MAFSYRFQLIAALSIGLGCSGAAAAQSVDPAAETMSAAFPASEASEPASTPEQDQAGAQEAGVVFAPVHQQAPDKVNTSRALSCDSKMAKLLDDPGARSVLERRIPDVVSSPQIVMARGITLKQLARFRQTGITSADLAVIDEELAAAARR